MEGNNYSDQGWTTILKTMAEHELNFVVVGGAALALHGLPRTTLDIDVFIPATTLEFEKLFHCLMDVLGLSSDQSILRKHSNQPHLFEGQWFSFANSDGLDVVDVFIVNSAKHTALKNSGFDVEFGKCGVKVASLEELKQMKLESARPIDLADVELINEILDLRMR